MGTGPIEQPGLVIGKLPVLINGSWPLEEIKSLVWRKLSSSTKANHLMAPEPIGSCTNIASLLFLRYNFFSRFNLRFSPLIHFSLKIRFPFSLQSSMGPTQNWVLCRIFLKKRAGNKNDDDDGDNRTLRYSDNNNNSNEQIEIITTNQSEEDETKPIFFDFMRKERTTDLNLLPSSPSSDHASSGVTTEIFSSDEETSSCNSFRRNL